MSNTNPLHRLASLALALFTMLVAGFVFFIAFIFLSNTFTAWSELDASEWPRTNANVIDANLIERSIKSKYADRPTRSYYTHIEYEYEIGAQTYRGSYATPSEDTQQDAEAAFRLMDESDSGRISVAYSASKPHISMYNPQDSSIFSVFFSGICALLFAGVGMTIGACGLGFFFNALASSM